MVEKKSCMLLCVPCVSWLLSQVLLGEILGNSSLGKGVQSRLSVGGCGGGLSSQTTFLHRKETVLWGCLSSSGEDAE